MKYKTHGTTGNHKIFVRKRETMFEYTDGTSSSFKDFVDHKEMKTWEFAEFQKEQFAKKKKERKRIRVILMVSVIVALILFYLVPIIFESLQEAGNFDYYQY